MPHTTAVEFVPELSYIDLDRVCARRVVMRTEQFCSLTPHGFRLLRQLFVFEQALTLTAPRTLVWSTPILMWAMTVQASLSFSLSRVCMGTA